MNPPRMSISQEKDIMSPEDVAAFWRNGFAGPFALDTLDDQLAELAEQYEDFALKLQPQPMYGRHSLRDWHLVDEELEWLLTQDAIVTRVARLLGPDLLLWRSEIRRKPPDARAAAWYQEWEDVEEAEIGSSWPPLQPTLAGEHVWDLTVWVALDEVTPANGPLQFAVGRNSSQVMCTRVPMVQSAFFVSVFEGLSKEEIVARTLRRELVRGIDTADWLDAFDPDAATLPGLTNFLRDKFDKLLATFTEFIPEPQCIATMVLSRGSFVIFSERIMHGSLPNLSGRSRLAVSCRIARAETLVYPGRLVGNFIDGSGLDISRHESLLISGRPREPRNVWRRKLD
jgi:non-heme Fe2+,alpha-ketoglutarate-dependent halogenase